MAKPKNGTEKDLSIQILVGLLGILMSVVLHEAFHILMHWDHIQHISLFPDIFTIVQIDVGAVPGSDIEGEEIAAYGITLLVLLITAMIIFKIRDTNDARSPGEILFPRDKDMQSQVRSNLLGLSNTNSPESSYVGEIGIKSSSLKEILEGKKTVEVRLAKHRYTKLKVGDKISLREDIWKKGKIVQSIPDSGGIVVVNIQRFNSFREAFKHIDYKLVRPSVHSVNAAIKTYELFYDRKDEKKRGVIAISFQLLEK